MKRVEWTLAGMSWAMHAVGAVAGETPTLVSARVHRVPAVDGDASDPAWKAARETKLVAKGVFPANAEKSSGVTMGAVHTETDVVVLVRWRDATRDDTVHKPFVWDAGKGAYLEGPEREVMLSLAFEHTGPFTGDMPSPVEAVWDVWHWKAARTDPRGLELQRKVDTGHADDTRFEVGEKVKMAVGVHDRTGDMDQASPVVELSFGGR